MLRLFLSAQDHDPCVFRKYAPLHERTSTNVVKQLECLAKPASSREWSDFRLFPDGAQASSNHLNEAATTTIKSG